MRDPDARTRPHHRFQRRHQAAGRMLHHDFSRWAPLMDARLAIREHDDAVAFEVRSKGVAESRSRPGALRGQFHLRRVREFLLCFAF